MPFELSFAQREYMAPPAPVVRLFCKDFLLFLIRRDCLALLVLLNLVKRYIGIFIILSDLI